MSSNIFIFYHRKIKYAIIFSLHLLFSSCKEAILYPYPAIDATPTVEEYHGNKVSDPFRILEDLENEDVKRWFDEQRAFYDSTISDLSQRDSLTEELDEIFSKEGDYTMMPRASQQGLYYCRYSYNEAVEKIFCSDVTGNKEKLIVRLDSVGLGDWNVDFYEPSGSGKYLAIGMSMGGSEMSVIRILDIEKKQFLADSLERAMGGNPQWLPDESGFFYQQMKSITPETENERYEDSAVKLHLIGASSDNDKVVITRAATTNLPIEKIDFPQLWVFPSSDKVILTLSRGTSKFSRLYWAELDEVIRKPSADIHWHLINDIEDKVSSFALHKDDLFLLSYQNNSNGTLELRNLGEPSSGKVLLEGDQFVLEDMVQTQSHLYLLSLNNVVNELFRIDLETFEIAKLDNVPQGSVYLRPFFEVSPVYFHHSQLIFDFRSWTDVDKIYAYDPQRNELTKTPVKPHSPFGDLDLVVEEVEVRSHDGERVPLSVIYKRGVVFDSGNPTLLTGYGAYGYSYKPFFSSKLLPWFNRGGIYAVAHVRGGGEKGEAWYHGGRKATKPNSWKDVNACAQYLIDNNYTSSDKLALFGISAGAVTIGRAFTERPDLYKAIVVEAGAFNVLRDEASFNPGNMDEFGSPKDSLEFTYLYEMDTYYHFDDELKYPSALLTAGMNDARVDPWHPAKIVARMQQASEGDDNIVLFQITGGGHFEGGSTSRKWGDIYSFLFWQLGDPDSQLKESSLFFK